MFLSIDQSHWTTPYIRQICSGPVTNRITACLTIVVTWHDYCSYRLTTVILSEAVFNYASWLAVAGALCLCGRYTEPMHSAHRNCWRHRHWSWSHNDDIITMSLLLCMFRPMVLEVMYIQYEILDCHWLKLCWCLFIDNKHYVLRTEYASLYAVIFHPSVTE